MDQCPESIADVYQTGGEAALRALPGIGQRIAKQIAAWLQENEVTSSFSRNEVVTP